MLFVLEYHLDRYRFRDSRLVRRAQEVALSAISCCTSLERHLMWVRPKPGLMCRWAEHLTVLAFKGRNAVQLTRRLLKIFKRYSGARALCMHDDVCFQPFQQVKNRTAIYLWAQVQVCDRIYLSVGCSECA